MNDFRYTISRDPKWIAMATQTSLLIVDRAVSAERAADLWSNVRGDSGQQAVLDALTRGGISSTPSFAFAELGRDLGKEPAPVTVVVRGDLEVTVVTPTGTVAVSGEGTSIWVERVVPDAFGIEFGTREAPGRSKAASFEFVLIDGSAPVSRLAAGREVSVAPVAAPAPFAAPVPPEAPHSAEPVDPGVTISEPRFDPESGEDEPESGYDFLFGETVMRTVEDAAVREDAALHEDATSATPRKAGDHDGKTAIGLTPEERRAAKNARRGAPRVPVVAAPGFVLVFSTGQREPLDRPVVVGRAPSASKVSANSVPRLVTVGGPDQDISRNHVQVALEGGTVLVTDLHSRNGTMVTLPGRAPQQLRGGQATAVMGGAVVDLGSGVSFTVGEE